MKKLLICRKSVDQQSLILKTGIITGWSEKLNPMDDEEFKVDFIIKKPFDLSELSKHINDVIGAE